MITGKFRILWDNKFDAATLVVSSEASGLPVENLQHDWFTKHWRSLGLTDEWIDADLGAAEAIKAFFIYSHNLRDTADLQIQGDDDYDSGTPPAVDDTIVITADMIANNIIGKFWTAVQAYRYWLQIITDDVTGHPDGYIREGRVFLGGYFEPTYRPSVYPATTDVDPSTILVSMGGQKQANIITPYQIIKYQWGALPASDIATLKTIFAAVGKNKSYFICEDSDNPITKTHYVKNVTDWHYEPVGGDYYSVEIEVETER